MVTGLVCVDKALEDVTMVVILKVSISQKIAGPGAPFTGLGEGRVILMPGLLKKVTNTVA